MSAKIEILGDKNLTADIAIEDAQSAIDNSRIHANVSPYNGDNIQLSTILFKDRNQFYFNPTEELSMGNYVNKGSSVLTVLSSGDFPLDSIYHGAKDIITFDINKYQYYIAMLKYLAITKLSYEEYYSFFCDISSNDYLSLKIYKKIISGNKKNPVLTFWDTFMTQRDLDMQNIRNNTQYLLAKYLSQDTLTPAMFDYNRKINDLPITATTELILSENGEKTPNSFLENEASYNLTKREIEKSETSFIKSNLIDLKNNLINAKNFPLPYFDTIYLSNIQEYLNPTVFKQAIDEQLMPMLKPDGSIVFCCQGITANTLARTSQDKAMAMRRKVLYSYNDLSSLVFSNDILAYQMLIASNYDVSTASLPSLTQNYEDTIVQLKKSK